MLGRKNARNTRNAEVAKLGLDFLVSNKCHIHAFKECESFDQKSNDSDDSSRSDG